MRFLLLYLSWLTLPLSVLARKGDWACKSALCIAAVVELNNVVHYELSTTLENVGWIGIGFGEHMVHTHSIVLWKNPADGSTVLSQRYADFYAEPHVVESPPRVATVVESKNLLPVPSSAPSSPPPTIFAFQIPLDTAKPARSDSLEPHIFALSYNSPLLPNSNGNLADPTAHIPFHSNAGVMMLNFTNDFVTSSTPHPPLKEPLLVDGVMTAKEDHGLENLIRLHAFLVSFGFLVLLPFGALVARYSRVFNVRLFPYHWKINFYLAGPVITFGVLLGPVIVFSKETFRIHFANGHEIIGILLLGSYYIQVLLGRHIHERRTRLARIGPITNPHPPLNIIHVAIGISIILTAFCQVYTGMQWWEIVTHRGPITNWALPAWKAWIPILFIAYFGGYTFLPRQFRIEREAAAGAYRPIPTDISSNQSQSTPLLAEEQGAAAS